MGTHSSILAWRIPWIGEPDGLQSMGLQRVRHDWATNTLTIKLLSMKAWDMPQTIKLNEACILLAKSSKIIILRTKDRTIRERWHSKVEDPHYNETWDDLTYFSICYQPSADLNKNQDSPGLTLYDQSPAWCEGEASYTSLMSTHRMRKKVVLFPSPLSFDCKLT